MIAGGQPLWETSADDLDAAVADQRPGVWNTAAAAVPAMLAGPEPTGCRFVAVASAAGSQGLFHLAGYTAVKHAVVGLVNGPRRRPGRAPGVTAVAVCPGSTRTPMLAATADLYDDAPSTTWSPTSCCAGPSTPTRSPQTIAFCCSLDGAALNGSVVHADGGFRG